MKLDFRFWLFGFFIIALLSCNKQGKVVGTVKDPITEKGVPQLTVTYSGYESGKAITNVNGTFNIETLVGEKHGPLKIFIDPKDNTNLQQDFYIPQNQTIHVKSSENAAEFVVYEKIQGNLILDDFTPTGDNYDYVEYYLFTKETRADGALQKKKMAPFVNKQIIAETFYRGKLYFEGKLHYQNGLVETVKDSVFVPKSVGKSYTWTIKF